jgi:hypothetical protein
MKKLITAIAIGAFAFVGTANNAEARPYWERGQSSPSSTTYVSGYRHGQPIYTERIFVGYDHCGNPRYTYRTISTPSRGGYGGDRCDSRSGGYGGHGNRNSGNSRSSYYNNGGRSGSSVSFSFRR